MTIMDVQFRPIPTAFVGDPVATADFISLSAIKGVNEGLCSLRDARHMAWSKFVIAMGLNPQICAKDFYKVFDRMWEGNKKLKKKPVRTSSIPPILTAPPELAADVLGTGPMGLPPMQAAKPNRQPKRTKPPAQPAVPPKYRLDRGGLTATSADRRAEQLYEHTSYKFIKIVKTAEGYAVYKAGLGEARREWTGAPRRYVDYPDKSMANWGIIHLRDKGCAAHMKPEGTRWVVYMGACNLSAQTGRTQPARTTKKQPKKTAAAKTRKTTKKPAKPKTKKTAATPKLTASQREYLAIQGFVMVKRGGKYVRITG